MSSPSALPILPLIPPLFSCLPSLLLLFSYPVVFAQLLPLLFYFGQCQIVRCVQACTRHTAGVTQVIIILPFSLFEIRQSGITPSTALRSFALAWPLRTGAYLSLRLSIWFLIKNTSPSFSWINEVQALFYYSHWFCANTHTDTHAQVDSPPLSWTTFLLFLHDALRSVICRPTRATTFCEYHDPDAGVRRPITGLYMAQH